MTEQNYLNPPSPNASSLVSIPEAQLAALQQQIIDLKAELAELQHRFAAAQGGVPG